MNWVITRRHGNNIQRWSSDASNPRESYANRSKREITGMEEAEHAKDEWVPDVSKRISTLIEKDGPGRRTSQSSHRFLDHLRQCIIQPSVEFFPRFDAISINLRLAPFEMLQSPIQRSSNMIPVVDEIIPT